jgi:hypothetical protein
VKKGNIKMGIYVWDVMLGSIVTGLLKRNARLVNTNPSQAKRLAKIALQVTTAQQQVQQRAQSALRDSTVGKAQSTQRPAQLVLLMRM